jgi:hypothetical protein
VTMKKRGTCRVCGRSIVLLNNGDVGLHGLKGTFPPQRCSGWGQMPATAKVAMAPDAKSIKDERDELTFKLVRLLTYVINMQEDFPDLDWPEFPDSYSDLLWRYAA